ncbi:methyl-accepting chemotaxis protein [Gemmata sp. JC673]|uniref:Methyl-accepting chemotaxis protein n=1 Tax=Gemmata algarum TaxID=2975278 RepID=A0ABU5F1Q0_9BACT|nr:methyl-accepting chemotaxis protein [Gemmata algarum]MDY3561429.1 methyl-accepting chemotaxis protein [Gemmata algarum]
MNWFRNLKVSSKIGISFGALIALMAAAGWVGLRGQAQVIDRTAIIARHADGLNHLQEANGELLHIDREVRNAILDTEPAAVDRRAADIRSYEARFRTEFDAYRRTIARDEQKARAADIERRFSELRTAQDAVVALAREHKDQEATARLPGVRAAVDAVEQGLNELLSSKQELMKALQAEANEFGDLTRTRVMGAVGGGCVLALGLGFALTALTARPLQQTKDVIEAVAKGDLTRHTEVRSRDEIGQMSAALNVAIDNLRAAHERDADFSSQLTAVNKVQAVIEFRLDGTIITANDNFLRALGYGLPEIQGRHHSMFAEPAFVASPEYREFWARLNRGEYVAGEFKRLGKGGKEVWIQASYNPILGPNGKPYKVVKFATDVTATKLLEQKVRDEAERSTTAAAELERKVGTIVQTVDALAAGDFTVSIPDLGDDNVGRMAASLNQAVESVRTALEGVKGVSEQLADASAQLSAASEEISSGAQEQASSLEETASALEEITATVQRSADSAQQARQLAGGSKEVAEKGGQVVSGAVGAMSEISGSSKKIEEIITTIDEIAFQTNLLALNAAVEAARAGEQGRGFAVVATEVRNLAQRSATAAKEIKGLIQDSVKKVETGTELVNKSGDALAEIVTSVKRVTDIVTEIAAASKEQSIGIDQVNKAVTQMDSATQRNAGQTEEMNATAQALTDQAAQLRDLIARFKLAHGQGYTGPTRASKKAASTKPRAAVAKAVNNRHGSSGQASNGRGHELDSLGGDGFADF